MLSNLPLVSVLIPSYNHENYVQGTIQSIINQTYKNIELIVVDDGSKDSTWQKINEMKETCSKRFVSVRFETKVNEGTCKTFNKLLTYANGEYVFIIASDDLATPIAIERQVDFLSKNSDYALCVGDNGIIDSEGRRCYWDEKRNIVYDKTKAKFLSFAKYLQTQRPFKFTSDKFGTYSSLYIGNYIPNGYLIRKSIFDLTGYYSFEAPMEDWYIMLQISKYAKMKYIDEEFFLYRWHQSNSIKSEEKMHLFTNKTRIYEEEILKNIDEKKVLSDVIETKKNGVLYNRFGIPYLFEILKYMKNAQRNIIIKLFNIKIKEIVK